jgi:hypothetical protein
MRHARWIDVEPAAFGMRVSYESITRAIFGGSPAMTLALPAAVAAYAGWKRARYFGNTAPLIIAALMMILAVGAADFPGQGFHLTMLVFLFVFVSGVFADLLETQAKLMVAAGLCGLLTAAAVRNLWMLGHLR